MLSWRITRGLLKQIKTLLCIALIGCSNTSSPPAPVVTLQPNTLSGKGTMDAAQQQYYVQGGDTLFRIAQMTGCNVQHLALQNQIAAPYLIYPGQVLQIAGPYCLAPTITVATDTPLISSQVTTNSTLADSSVTHNSTARNPMQTTGSKPITEQGTKIIIAEGVAPLPDLPQRTVTRWHWPTSGKIINSFSAADGGNKGIDLAGKRGQAVYSSAAGRVVYAGSALRGYGNLLIIKHNEEYLSAYAHNDSLLVQEQQTVTAGQKIATMGNTGTRLVHLHFEIRYKGKSVNPLRYLPQR